jgi:uncharacterized protein
MTGRCGASSSSPTGRPEIFFEERASGRLIQASCRDDLAPWSIHPSGCGRHVLFTAGRRALRLDLETLAEDARFRAMDAGGPHTQVLTLAMPPLEVIDPERAPELARIANDGMAELVARHPDRFLAFAAAVPLRDVEAGLAEIERAVDGLGARGIQVPTNVLGRPLDLPELRPLFARMAQLDLPIWLHPARGSTFADNASEEHSRYEIWWALGWPYQTTAAMARLVFFGLFERLPEIKIITHHMGGLAPMLEGRLAAGWDQLGCRTPASERDLLPEEPLGGRPVEHFRRFYADTALFGSQAATACGLAFFGTERVVFATDFPFDPMNGALFARETARILDQLGLCAEARAAIDGGTIRRLMRLPP